MPLSIKLAFAGLGSLIFHWGIGVAVIIICLALEIFTAELGVIPIAGPFLVRVFTPLRKDLLWTAACAAICMAVYGMGVHDGSKRAAAKAKFVQTTVDKVVRDATSPSARGVRDRYDSDK